MHILARALYRGGEDAGVGSAAAHGGSIRQPHGHSVVWSALSLTDMPDVVVRNVAGHLGKGSGQNALRLTHPQIHGALNVMPEVVAAIKKGLPKQATSLLRKGSRNIHSDLTQVFGLLLMESPQHILHAVDVAVDFSTYIRHRSAYRDLVLRAIQHPGLTSGVRKQMWEKMEGSWSLNTLNGVMLRNEKLTAPMRTGRPHREWMRPTLRRRHPAGCCEVQ
jgi:hypothetical protein